MKGSTLDGAEFHETAMVQEMRHIIGHLNGNAICESTYLSLSTVQAVFPKGKG